MRVSLESRETQGSKGPANELQTLGHAPVAVEVCFTARLCLLATSLVTPLLLSRPYDARQRGDCA